MDVFLLTQWVFLEMVMEKFFDYPAQVVDWNWENLVTRFTFG